MVRQMKLRILVPVIHPSQEVFLPLSHAQYFYESIWLPVHCACFFGLPTQQCHRSGELYLERKPGTGNLKLTVGGRRSLPWLCEFLVYIVFPLPRSLDSLDVVITVGVIFVCAKLTRWFGAFYTFWNWLKVPRINHQSNEVDVLPLILSSTPLTVTHWNQRGETLGGCSWSDNMADTTRCQTRSNQKTGRITLHPLR